MDPNANLEELRRLAKALAEGRYTSAWAQADDARRLAELVIALDGWLSKGSFLPKAWAPAALAACLTPARGCHGNYNGEHVLSCPLYRHVHTRNCPADCKGDGDTGLRPTRAAFLEAYRAKTATFGWAKANPDQLTKFMLEVRRCLEGDGALWNWDTPYALQVFRAIGGTGRLTLKALRALP